MAIPDYQSLMRSVLEVAAETETSVPLTELMVEHGVGVRSSRVLEFKCLDEDSSQRLTPGDGDINSHGESAAVSELISEG